jgi:hypothetical protein
MYINVKSILHEIPLYTYMEHAIPTCENPNVVSPIRNHAPNHHK